MRPRCRIFPQTFGPPLLFSPSMKRPFARLFVDDYLVRSLVAWPLGLAVASLAVCTAINLDAFFMLALLGTLYLLFPAWVALLVGTLVLRSLESRAAQMKNPVWLIGLVFFGLWTVLSGAVAYGLEIFDKPLYLLALLGWSAMFIGTKAVLDVRRVMRQG